MNDNHDQVTAVKCTTIVMESENAPIFQAEKENSFFVVAGERLKESSDLIEGLTLPVLISKHGTIFNKVLQSLVQQRGKLTLKMGPRNCTFATAKKFNNYFSKRPIPIGAIRLTESHKGFCFMSQYSAASTTQNQ